MKLLILGTTGRTGKLLTKTAIARNHQVTAIIRDKSHTTLPKVKHLEGSLAINAHIRFGQGSSSRNGTEQGEEDHQHKRIRRW